MQLERIQRWIDTAESSPADDENLPAKAPAARGVKRCRRDPISTPPFVALSIETKKPSENLEAAELQLSVWDMARWSLLRRLVELKLLSATTTYQDVDEAASSLDKEAVQAQLPEFLPGIIVQGHDWLLVVTTMECEKTALWQKLTIGSTATARGVYQIVRTLQRLETWAREVQTSSHADERSSG